MKLTEIAKRIHTHLRAIEESPIRNPPDVQGYCQFYKSSATRQGAYVFVVYKEVQGATSMTKAEALAYLQWLDQGYTGTHRDAGVPVGVARREALAKREKRKFEELEARYEEVRREREVAEIQDRLALCRHSLARVPMTPKNQVLLNEVVDLLREMAGEVETRALGRA